MLSVTAHVVQFAQSAPDASVAWGAIVLAVVTSVTSLVTLALNLRHDKKITELQGRNDQCEQDREQDRRSQAALKIRLDRHEKQAKRRRKRARARIKQRFEQMENQLAHKKDATDGHTPLSETESPKA